MTNTGRPIEPESDDRKGSSDEMASRKTTTGASGRPMLSEDLLREIMSSSHRGNSHSSAGGCGVLLLFPLLGMLVLAAVLLA